MQIQKEKNFQNFILFSNVFETSSFTKQGSLRSLGSLPASLAEGSDASEVYRFQKSPKEYVQKLSEVYRKQNYQKNGFSLKMGSSSLRRAHKITSVITRRSTENRMTKRMGFRKLSEDTQKNMSLRYRLIDTPLRIAKQ